MLPIFIKLQYFDNTAPKALPPAPARTFAVTLKLRYSFITVPKYLYLSTISSTSMPYLKTYWLLGCYGFLKCTTLVISLFTVNLHLWHQLFTTLSILCKFISLSVIKTTSSANKRIEILIFSNVFSSNYNKSPCNHEETLIALGSSFMNCSSKHTYI